MPLVGVLILLNIPPPKQLSTTPVCGWSDSTVHVYHPAGVEGPVGQLSTKPPIGP